jgi:hypothetical protein
MDRRDIAALLALMAARDGRTVGPVEVEAWLEDAGRWDLPTAREAVHRHYSASREFMRPYDLVKSIRQIRGDRLTAAGEILPPAHLADDPRAEITWSRRVREQIAAGRPAPIRTPFEVEGRPGHVVALVREVATAKRLPAHNAAAEPALRQALPAATVDAAAAAAMEAERARQLQALGRLTEGGAA